MHGKRKSPFVGVTVPLNEGSDPILYRRYTNPADVLVGSPASALPAKLKPAFTASASKQSKQDEPASAAVPPLSFPAFAGNAPAAANGDAAVPEDGPVQKVRKKARWSEEQKEAAKAVRKPAAAIAAPAPAPVGAIAGEEVGATDTDPTAADASKKKTKALKVRKLAPEERVSGPSNAEEAEKLRIALGFVPVPDAAPAGAFSFGFAAVEAAAGPQQPAEPLSTDDSSSDSDSGVSGEQKAAPATAAAAVPAGGSDTSSDSDSDDSTSSSSSDEEEVQPPAQSAPPAAATAAAAAPAWGAAPAAPAPTKPAAIPTASDLDSEFVPRRVYIGGMPFSYSEAEVIGFWEYCGTIESLDLLTFPDTGRFRGIAFITYADEEGYLAALACDGGDCDGQTLKVQRCKWSAKDRRAHQAAIHAAALQQPAPAPVAAAALAAAPSPAAAAALASPRPQHVAPAPKTAGYNVAYVGNIAYEADEAALRALFAQVTKVRIHTDKDTGRPKGFAHIHFLDEASLDAAVALDGTNLMGRKIRVGYAQPKKVQPEAVA